MIGGDVLLGKLWTGMAVVGIFLTGGLILTVIVQPWGPSIEGELKFLFLGILIVQILTLGSLRELIPRVFPDEAEDAE